MALLIYTSSIHGNVLITYWWIMFIPIVLAPFFEWFVHKYILHLKIGKFKEVDVSIFGDVKPGDSIDFEKSRYKVLSIENGLAKIGFGMATKLPEFIRNGMYILHYGHHENPNNIKLIFAPITFSVGLFVSMFLTAYLITFRLDIALLYT
ncbi:hypothetical protein N9529_06405, partial [Crocinitomicaceae bacterium]|nr:hypothetical protein [Crocinitomicaceae bacterium]